MDCVFSRPVHGQWICGHQVLASSADLQQREYKYYWKWVTNGESYLSGCMIRNRNSGRIWIALGTGGNIHFAHRVKFKRNFICLLKVGSLEFVVSSKQRDVEPRTL
jgi:hypothetical protein